MMEVRNMLILNILLYIFNFVIFCLLFFPSLLYRIIATILIKLQYKDAIMLSGADSILAYGQTADENQLMYCFLCHGTIHIDYFRSQIMEKLVKKQERTQCYLQKKFGYYFWLKEKNFNIKDHVIYHHDLSISTKDQWEKIQNRLYYDTPIPNGLSPWYIHFIPLNPDYEETNENSSFYMVPMIYHSVGDGYSLISSFLQCIDDDEVPKLILPSLPPPSLFKEVLGILLGFFLIPYYFTDYFIYRPDLFIRSKKREKQIYSDIGKIKTESITIIKRSTGVPFIVVLLSCITGVLEKYFQNSKRPMPREIRMSIPKVLWRPEDKVTLVNNFVLAYLTLPLNRKCGKDRLEEIYKIINASSTQNRFIANYLIMKFLAYIVPSFIMRWFHSRDEHSIFLSIAALEHLPHSILGNRRISDVYLKRMFILISNIKIVFHTITVGEDISLSIHSNSTIISKTDLQQMTKDFKEELRKLKENISYFGKRI